PTRGAVSEATQPPAEQQEQDSGQAEQHAPTALSTTSLLQLTIRLAGLFPPRDQSAVSAIRLAPGVGHGVAGTIRSRGLGRPSGGMCPQRPRAPGWPASVAARSSDTIKSSTASAY